MLQVDASIIPLVSIHLYGFRRHSHSKSIFSQQLSCHIQATVYAIAEKVIPFLRK